jgi:hypothetical protein
MLQSKRLPHIGWNRNVMLIHWAKINGRIQHGLVKLHREKDKKRGRSWKHLKEDFETNV